MEEPHRVAQYHYDIQQCSNQNCLFQVLRLLRSYALCNMYLPQHSSDSTQNAHCTHFSHLAPKWDCWNKSLPVSDIAGLPGMSKHHCQCLRVDGLPAIPMQPYMSGGGQLSTHTAMHTILSTDPWLQRQSKQEATYIALIINRGLPSCTVASDCRSAQWTQVYPSHIVDRWIMLRFSLTTQMQASRQTIHTDWVLIF